jgi:hypothetical protein
MFKMAVRVVDSMAWQVAHSKERRNCGWSGWVGGGGMRAWRECRQDDSPESDDWLEASGWLATVILLLPGVRLAELLFKPQTIQPSCYKPSSHLATNHASHEAPNHPAILLENILARLSRHLTSKHFKNFASNHPTILLQNIHPYHI